MKTLAATLLTCFLIAEPVALARDPQTGNLSGGTTPAAASTGGALEPATAREVPYLKDSVLAANVAVRTFVPQQNQPNRRSWIGQHPVLFGTLVGFGAGFAFGYKTGDPAARNCPGCDNLTPEAKGVLFAGVGAGVGALVGLTVGAVRK